MNRLTGCIPIPKAKQLYADKVKRPLELINTTVENYYPKPTMQSDTMADFDGAVRDAVKLKFLEQPLTKEQLVEFLQIPPNKK